MSSEGDDPKDKRPPPPSTLAGVVPQPPKPGLPPPRSTHGGGAPPPRPGQTPGVGQAPFSQPQPRDPSQPNPAPPGRPQPASQPPPHGQPPHARPQPASQPPPQGQPHARPQSPSQPPPQGQPHARPQSPSQPPPHAQPQQPHGQPSQRQPQPHQPYQPPHGQPPHGQPPHGQPPHAQPSPPHGQPPHGQPPYAQPPQQPPYQQQQPHTPFSPPQQPSPFAPPSSPPASGGFPDTPPMLKDPEWAQGFPNQPQGQQPLPTATARPRPGVPESDLLQSESSPIEKFAETAAEVPGRFMGFLKISAKRAFRLRIEPSEVLPDERHALATANPPIVDENLQAFLSWRRSVIFLVATIMTVLSIMGLVDALGGTRVASSVRWVKLLPTLAECAFCVICWMSLRHWTQWRKQRRWLLIGWLLFMLTPFVVYMYPLKWAVMEAGKAMTVEQMRVLGWNGVYNRAVAPFAFAMLSMLQLAPKVISLMPGLIRSAMVIKLLFPGAAAPGWLIVMCAPLYGMIAYAILVIPYQFTAEPWFMFGVVLIVLAQVLVMRSGFALAKPLTQEEALRHIRRIRTFYMVLLLTAAVAIIGGLWVLVRYLRFEWTTVITTLLKFEANVMILTTIGA
ncbi:MAG TPA: hypothetical protein VIV11_20695, partial [Kofleriaceae bacterium]